MFQVRANYNITDLLSTANIDFTGFEIQPE